MMLKATTEVNQMSDATATWSKPCLYVELESEDPQSARTINISGKRERQLKVIYDQLQLFDNKPPNSP